MNIPQELAEDLYNAANRLHAELCQTQQIGRVVTANCLLEAAIQEIDALNAPKEMLYCITHDANITGHREGSAHTVRGGSMWEPCDIRTFVVKP